MTNSEEITKALDIYFNQNRKFIDTSRIPLICQDIHGIHESQKEMKQMLADVKKNFVNQDQFWPVKTIVYTGAGIILVTVFTAMVYLAIHQGK